MKQEDQDYGRGKSRSWLSALTLGAIASGVLMGCSPTVKIEAPDKPIEINLNIKIEQDVRIRLDKDVESLIANNPDIF